MCCSKVIIWRIIAIISMLISCIMIALAIGGILTYHCTFNPDLSSFQMDNFYLIYTVYFFNSKCADGSSDYRELNTDASDRTWGWAIAYLVLHTLWFFSSLLLFNATNYWKSPTGLFLTYPWLFITFIILCADVAATIMYALDFQSIETLEKLYRFVGITFIPAAGEIFRLSPAQAANAIGYIPLSCVVMVAAFSKLIIGWLVVFINFIIIFILLIKVGKNEPLILETRPPRDYYNSAITNPGFEMRENQQSDSLQYLQRNGHLSFVEIPLEDDLPQHFIPRPSLHNTNREDFQQANYNRQMELSQINSEYFSDEWNQDYRSPMSPQSPRSILKSQQNNRFSNDLHNQKPWTYLPSSQPESSLESEHGFKKPSTQTYYY